VRVSGKKLPLFGVALAGNASPGQYQAEIGGYPGNVRLRGYAVTALGLSTAPQTTRRGILQAVLGVCIFGWGLRSARAQETTKIRIQLDQHALNTVPGGELAGLEVTEDTSPEAQALKARSPPGKAIPIIYLIVGFLSLPSIWAAVQEMLRRREYGAVVIDLRTIPANIHHHPSIPADLVLLIQTDGSPKTVHSTLATEDFLKSVLVPHAH
jgi:hypothetical protein